MSHSSGPTNGRRRMPPVTRAPFPIIAEPLGKERERSRARPFLARRSKPLTSSFPSLSFNSRERGPGVSGGLSPWRSLRQRLMRAFARRLFSNPSYSGLYLLSLRLLFAHPLHSRAFPASFRLSRLAESMSMPPCFHPHSWWTPLRGPVHVDIRFTRDCQLSIDFPFRKAFRPLGWGSAALAQFPGNRRRQSFPWSTTGTLPVNSPSLF